MKYAVIILVFAAAVLTYFQFRQRQAVKALSDRLFRLLGTMLKYIRLSRNRSNGA